MHVRRLAWITIGLLFGGAACSTPPESPTAKQATTGVGGGNSGGSGGSSAATGSAATTGPAITGGTAGSAATGSTASGNGGAPSPTTGTGGASGSGGGASAPPADAGEAGASRDAAGSAGVYVVGYLPNYAGSYATWANKIKFDKMTHLNLAFAKATATNDWSMGATDADVKAIVDKAHAAGTKVLASLGGGGGDQTVIAQYKTASNIDVLVTKLDAFITAHNFDGADVDIEDPNNLGAAYSTFVDKTVAKLRPEGKLVTAAVAQYLQGSMSDATLHQFDFINVMIYSNLQQVMTDVGYYANTKKVSKAQIVLGAGFFGTDSTGKEYAYADIIKADPLAWQKDQTQVGGQAVKYTGVTSMVGLVQYAKTIGGIMFWDLSEDTADEHSLWKAIQDNM